MTSSATRSNALVGEVLALGPAPLLKSLGFRRNGHHFVRISADASCHLKLQSSQWNSPARTRFTVNLLVYLPVIALAMGDKVIDDPMKRRFGHCGIRIGHLFPEPGDHWWQIDTPADTKQIADEVSSAIEQFAIPYFERAATLQGVAELGGVIPGICDLPTDYKATALRLLGREQEAIVVEHAISAHEKKQPRDQA